MRHGLWVGVDVNYGGGSSGSGVHCVAKLAIPVVVVGKSCNTLCTIPGIRSGVKSICQPQTARKVSCSMQPQIQPTMSKAGMINLPRLSSQGMSHLYEHCHRILSSTDHPRVVHMKMKSCSVNKAPNQPEKKTKNLQGVDQHSVKHLELLPRPALDFHLVPFLRPLSARGPSRAGLLAHAHGGAILRRHPKYDEWCIEARDKVPTEAPSMVRPMMKSCRSVFEPAISHAAGLIVIVLDRYVTLDRLDKPITEVPWL
jgi:hypothetical protein